MKYYYLIILYTISFGVFSGEWDYPAGNEVVSNKIEAQSYIEKHYPDIGEVSFRYESQSILGYQYNFNINKDGQYKAQRVIVLHSNKNRIVERIFKSLEDTILRNGEATIAAEIEKPRRLKADVPPSIDSGVLVSQMVNIVDPDLRTMDRLTAPEHAWADINQYPIIPHFVLKQVEMLEVGNRVYLSNRRVTQVDADYLEEQDPNTDTWSKSSNTSFMPKDGITSFDKESDLQDLTFASPDFTQVMAFYQIDQSLQYLESLGYQLFSEPVKFDAQGLANNNSSYYFGPKALMFGVDGGSADALDADVVIHELAHGIHYHILPDWAYGHTGAIAEGFADYWAGSNSYRRLFELGDVFEIDTVFNWDGYFGSKISTRSLWNQRAQYFEQSEYRAHESVGGKLGDELWSTPLFQTLKQSVDLYGEIAFKEVDTLVLESMFGMGRGMKMHDLAESMLYVAQSLYPSRDYYAVLKKNLEKHGLFKEPFLVEMNSRYVDPLKPIEIRLVSNGRTANVEGKIDTSIGESTNIQGENVDTITTELQLPTTSTCGKEFDITVNLKYQFTPNLLSSDWLSTSSMVLGIPIFSQPAKVQNSIIPDASLSNSGTINYGFKTFNFIITNDSSIVADDFGVYLNFSHSNFSDLQITLVSPSGKRKMLIQNKHYSLSHRTYYWVVKYDEQLQTFAGEPIAGSWRLEVTDVTPEDTGELIEWGVGRVTHYSCENTSTVDVPDDNNDEDKIQKSTSGGSASLWSLFVCALLFYRRRFFN